MTASLDPILRRFGLVYRAKMNRFGSVLCLSLTNNGIKTECCHS